MLVQIPCLVIGRPDPFHMDNGRTLNFVEVLADNPDGTSEKIRLRSYTDNFAALPLKEPLVLEGNVKLYSKDRGKTTSLELVTYKVLDPKVK